MVLVATVPHIGVMISFIGGLIRGEGGEWLVRSLRVFFSLNSGASGHMIMAVQCNVLDSYEYIQCSVLLFSS